MAWLTEEQLQEMGFKYIGENVKLSDKASYYNCDRISIGDNSRIDDFCVISGKNNHYIPLHTSPAGLKHGEFIGEDKYTTKESERLVRLPLWYGMSEDVVSKIVDHIQKIFKR